MKVTTNHGTNSYANIKEGNREINVLLTPGRTPAESLRDSAREMREKAEELNSRADLIERAAKAI